MAANPHAKTDMAPDTPPPEYEDALLDGSLPTVSQTQRQPKSGANGVPCQNDLEKQKVPCKCCPSPSSINQEESISLMEAERICLHRSSTQNQIHIPVILSFNFRNKISTMLTTILEWFRATGLPLADNRAGDRAPGNFADRYLASLRAIFNIPEPHGPETRVAEQTENDDTSDLPTYRRHAMVLFWLQYAKETVIMLGILCAIFYYVWAATRAKSGPMP